MPAMLLQHALCTHGHILRVLLIRYKHMMHLFFSWDPRAIWQRRLICPKVKHTLSCDPMRLGHDGCPLVRSEDSCIKKGKNEAIQGWISHLSLER